MLVRVLVAIGTDQLGQLLDVRADLQRLDRPGKAWKVKIAGLLHDLVEEIIDGKPERLPGKVPQVHGQAAGPAIFGLLQDVKEPPAFIPRPARPAAGLDRIDGVARQAQQPHQADRVIRAVCRPQERQAVFDLGLLVKAATATHLIGDADPLQRAGEIVEVRIGAEQDRDRIRPVTPLVDRGLDVGRHRIRLVGHAGCRQHTDWAALAPRGLEPFLQPLRVQSDQPAGGAQDRAATPEVLFQPNHSGIRKHRPKAAQVGNRGATKLVDTLVIVTHHAQVSFWSGEQLQQSALAKVRVLKLIDHQVGESLGLTRRDRGLVDQQLDRVIDGVIEIETLLHQQSLLVVAVDEGGFTLGNDHRVLDIDHATGPGNELIG